MNKINYNELITQIKKFNAEMAKHDEKTWRLEQKVLDLQSQIGHLSLASLERNGFKNSNSDINRIGEIIATIVILTLDISEETGIDLPLALSKLISRRK